MTAFANRHTIKIVHVAGGLGIGGTEKTMQLFATGINRERFTAYVYSHRDGPRRALIEQAGVKVFVGQDLFSILERIKPHIIHVHRAGWPERQKMRAIILHKGRKTLPIVMETNVFGRYDNTPDDAYIDRHIFVSKFCLERYLRHNAIEAAPPKYSYLYNPIEVDAFHDAAYKRVWDANSPVVGRLSRDDPGKWSPVGWEFLPLALKRCPSLKYRIIGAIEAAKRYFENNGLVSSVQLSPTVLNLTELCAFYASLNIFLHANKTGESFGNVIAEAMASGLPVVTLASEGDKDNAQAELVDHGVTGYVARTLEEYAGHVATLLGDLHLAKRMGQRGYEKAKREFDAPVVTRKLEAIYEESLALALARPV